MGLLLYYWAALLGIWIFYLFIFLAFDNLDDEGYTDWFCL